MRKYKQRGENSKYPEEVEIWKFGEPIPDWLSDQARIKFIDGNGNKTLDYRGTVSGGVEILKGNGKDALVVLRSRSDIVCKKYLGNIFSLSTTEFELLYE